MRWPRDGVQTPARSSEGRGPAWIYRLRGDHASADGGGQRTMGLPPIGFLSDGPQSFKAGSTRGPQGGSNPLANHPLERRTQSSQHSHPAKTHAFLHRGTGTGGEQRSETSSIRIRKTPRLTTALSDAVRTRLHFRSENRATPRSYRRRPVGLGSTGHLRCANCCLCQCRRRRCPGCRCASLPTPHTRC